MACAKELIKLLKEFILLVLTKKNVKEQQNKCEKIMHGIFNCIGEEQNDEEKIELRAALRKTILHILNFLDVFVYDFIITDHRVENPLEFRSILEDLITWKVIPKDLQSKTDHIKLELDKICFRFKSYVLVKGPGHGWFTREELVKPTKIPESHTWWLEY